MIGIHANCDDQVQGAGLAYKDAARYRAHSEHKYMTHRPSAKYELSQYTTHGHKPCNWGSRLQETTSLRDWAKTQKSRVCTPWFKDLRGNAFPASTDHSHHPYNQESQAVKQWIQLTDRLLSHRTLGFREEMYFYYEVYALPKTMGPSGIFHCPQFAINRRHKSTTTPLPLQSWH